MDINKLTKRKHTGARSLGQTGNIFDLNTPPMNITTTKERAAFWQALHQQYAPALVADLLQTLAPDTATVLRLHYYESKTLKEITALIGRSITTVRGHHNRGIFKLHKLVAGKP